MLVLGGILLSLALTPWLLPPLVGLSLFFAEFRVRRWTAEVPCLVATEPVLPACRMSGISGGRSWALFLLTLFWLFGLQLTGLVSMSVGRSGVLVLRLVFSVLVGGRAALLLLVCRLLLADVHFGSDGGGWVAGLLQEPVHDLPWSGSLEDLFEMAKAKKSTAGGLDGWVWNKIKALPLAWFSGLAILLNMVESPGVWPKGLVDAYTAMIPNINGDSTPLGQDCALWCLLKDSVIPASCHICCRTCHRTLLHISLTYLNYLPTFSFAVLSFETGSRNPARFTEEWRTHQNCISHRL